MASNHHVMAEDLRRHLSALVKKEWSSIMPSSARPRWGETTKIEDAGVCLGAVDGYRLWRVVDGHRLFSVGMTDYAWLPGAAATGDPDRLDQGVYAFCDPTEAARNFELSKLDWLPRTFCWGQVKLWGRIVEHERGYRAENARIVGLCEATPGVDLDSLRALYLSRRAPAWLTRVVDREGRTRGVTSLTPRFSRFVGDDPSSVLVSEPYRAIANLFEFYTPVNGTFRTQTHRWRGRDLLLEEGQDPTWLPGWLPLPSGDEPC